MTVFIRPAPKVLVCEELDGLPAPMVPHYLVVIAEKTLRNWRASGDGPPHVKRAWRRNQYLPSPKLLEARHRAWDNGEREPSLGKPVVWHFEYPISGLENWIDANVKGSGRRHQYFPIERVPPEEVARYLIASDSAQFSGKGVDDVVGLLEYMRRASSGPLWLKFKVSRRVTYFIPDILEWAEQRGIHSDYVMRAMVAEVIVKPPVQAPEGELLTQEARFHAVDLLLAARRAARGTFGR